MVLLLGSRSIFILTARGSTGTGSHGFWNRFLKSHWRPWDRAAVRHQRSHRRHPWARKTSGVRPQDGQHLPLHLRHKVPEPTRGGVQGSLREDMQHCISPGFYFTDQGDSVKNLEHFIRILNKWSRFEDKLACMTLDCEMDPCRTQSTRRWNTVTRLWRRSARIRQQSI